MFNAMMLSAKPTKFVSGFVICNSLSFRNACWQNQSIALCDYDEGLIGKTISYRLFEKERGEFNYASNVKITAMPQTILNAGTPSSYHDRDISRYIHLYVVNNKLCATVRINLIPYDGGGNAWSGDTGLSLVVV